MYPTKASNSSAVNFTQYHGAPSKGISAIVDGKPRVIHFTEQQWQQNPHVAIETALNLGGQAKVVLVAGGELVSSDPNDSRKPGPFASSLQELEQVLLTRGVNHLTVLTVPIGAPTVTSRSDNSSNVTSIDVTSPAPSNTSNSSVGMYQVRGNAAASQGTKISLTFNGRHPLIDFAGQLQANPVTVIKAQLNLGEHQKLILVSQGKVVYTDLASYTQAQQNGERALLATTGQALLDIMNRDSVSEFHLLVR